MTDREVILTEICSKSNKAISYSIEDDSSSRVIIETRNITSWNFLQKINSMMKSIFLPKGYPNSVSKDYLEYQIWDSCQAFCSSISGTLSMRAVMHGIGVGSEAATPASAAITWIMKDGTGMIGSILFASLKGSKLDSECKKWRLFADVLNDLAMFIELYIPYHLEYAMSLLFVATVFKAIVGTAGGSTRAALITHQAIKGNIADVAAKDGSQEIFINLCAFILGVFLLKNVTETREVWTIMCTAIFFHLLFNYKAVRCLRMNVLNTERFCLVLRAYLPTSSLPTIEQVNKRESVLLFQGLSQAQVFGFSVVFGVSLKKVIQTQNMTVSQFTNLVTLFQSSKYIIMPHIKKKKFYVTFRKNFTPRDLLKAYFHASLLGISLIYLENTKALKVMSRIRINSPIFRLKNILNHSSELSDKYSAYIKQEQLDTKLMLAYTACKDFIDKEFIAFCWACKEQGWYIDKHLISTDEWYADWAYVLQKKLDEQITSFIDLTPQNPNLSVKSKETMTNRKQNILVIS